MSKTSWPMKTLGEVCDFVRGVTYDKADARSETKSGFIPLLRATNITEKGLLHEDFVFIPSHGVRADQKLMSGDALITIASGSASVVGRSVLVEDPGEMTFGAFCGVLRPGPKILPRYLSHFMSSRSVRTAWSEAAQGTNINNLKRDDILQTECFLPPLDEQKRIVALLDNATARVTELTSCYEQSRTHANNLFVSALRDSLASNPDWPVKTLGEVCSIKSVLVDPKDLKYSGMIHIGAGNIEAKTGRLFGIKTAREEKLISGKFLYSENDVLYSKIRPYLEKVALPAQAGLCSADIYPLQPGPLLTRMFLFYTLVSETFTEYAISGSSRTGMPKVNREHLFKYEMKVPPLAVQTEIVERLDATRIKKSEMVAAYDAKLTAVRNLRQSILEAAISGDL